MIDEQHSLRAKITDIRVALHWYREEANQACANVLQLTLEELHFADNERNRVYIQSSFESPIMMHLSKEMAHAYGFPWDGSVTSAEELQKNFVGKVLIMSRGVEK